LFLIELKKQFSYLRITFNILENIYL